MPPLCELTNYCVGEVITSLFKHMVVRISMQLVEYDLTRQCVCQAGNTHRISDDLA